MAISNTVQTMKTLPFPSADPRFPNIRFVAGDAVNGDASGGTVRLAIELGLTPAGVLSGLIFGIDRAYAVFEGTGTVAAVSLSTVGWVLTEQQSQASAIVLPMVTVDSGLITVSELRKGRILLGRQSGPSVSASVRFEFDVNTNTLTYRTYVTGYIWKPIAALEGGPLWPGDFPTP